jgi:Chlorophyll A-B binding protein
MFAFVGYIVHANGIKFPWAMQLDGTPFPSVNSAPEAWDQISDAAKWQIFIFIGFLEFVSEVGVCLFACECQIPMKSLNFHMHHSDSFFALSTERLLRRSTTCEEESQVNSPHLIPA